jgi:hypothetical protein
VEIEVLEALEGHQVPPKHPPGSASPIQIRAVNGNRQPLINHERGFLGVAIHNEAIRIRTREAHPGGAEVLALVRCALALNSLLLRSWRSSGEESTKKKRMKRPGKKEKHGNSTGGWGSRGTQRKCGTTRGKG